MAIEKTIEFVIETLELISRGVIFGFGHSPFFTSSLEVNLAEVEFRRLFAHTGRGTAFNMEDNEPACPRLPTSNGRTNLARITPEELRRRMRKEADLLPWDWERAPCPHLAEQQCHGSAADSGSA